MTRVRTGSGRTVTASLDGDRTDRYPRRRVLRTGAALAGTAAAGGLAGCLGAAAPERSGQVAYPLDRDDPRVRAARAAEARAYDHYGLEFQEHFLGVPELGLDVRVVEVGSGPPVVLIPGGIGESTKWLPLLPELDGYTAYVLDRPGGGLSDGIDHRELPMADIAAATTAAVFDRFDLDPAPLVGGSMGGLWSLRFALAHPKRASRVALLGCPALYPGTSAPFPNRLTSLPGVGRTVFENVVRPSSPADVRDGWGVLGHPEGMASALPDAYAAVTYRMDDLPYFLLSWVSLSQSVLTVRGARSGPALSPGDLSRVRAPVSLLWGSDDPFGSVSRGRAGAEYFRDAGFHRVGVGHLPWLDEPAHCGELIREFLG